ncbi:hypothetical protein PIB30_096368 [Stylosanthes scabra]|uniref:Uncharacterized protein n=1 Tax=Stylosanthes scabra TaxID=79078 RepID=A0ABU6YVM0_9FABA|nr:hypothetical protein [Stylosanthes scabra]
MHLELVSCIHDDLDCIGAKEVTQVRFSSLKTLKMSYCHPNLVMKILPGCPVLEILDLEQMKGKISVFKIHAPLLKRLYFSNSTSLDELTELLEIHTPLVEYLNICVTSPPYKTISLCNLPNLIEAYIDCFASERYVGYVPQLLTLLSKVKSLLCLIHATPLDLPKFRYLRNLEIVHGRFNPTYIFGMLEIWPMLRVLTVHQIGVAKDPWTKPTSVPYCLASKLSKDIAEGVEKGAGDDWFES